MQNIQTLVSTKYQVVIPRKIRKKTGIKPGQRLVVHLSGEQIILSPKRSWPGGYLKNLQGKLGVRDTNKYLSRERETWE